ncbi:ABC transporter permease [Brucella anthropi]|uniref:ABC transporter permease n=1 Tax=Brucella anthropi TaxID=529 RepID=UPI000F67C730|nr:ABC transporter permease [Brucella anthropi]RRY17094.1 ABC transporter permease [Brucella anthropi]
MSNVFRAGIGDYFKGWKSRRLWLAIAKEDVDDSHKNTLLGPFWLLLNYLTFIGTFGFVMQSGAGDDNYLAYISVGLLIWFFVLEVITQGVSLFSREESFIKGTPLPLSTYVFRLTMQSVIRNSYALLGCLGVLILTGVYPSVTWFWSALGVVVVILSAPAVITVCAFVGAYFPDSRYLISNAMRVGMFLTPVFWTYNGSHGVRHLFYWYNPFTYFVEMVRIPIVNGTTPLKALFLCVLIGIVMWVAAVFLMGRYRKKVVFIL